MRSTKEEGMLRSSVVHGGRLLFARQVVGLLLSVTGVLVVTRFIGAESYGTYTAAFGVMFLVQTLGEFSLDVYVVRHSGTLPERVYHQVFTLLCVSVPLTSLLLAAAIALLDNLVGLPGFRDIGLALTGAVVLMHLQQVPLSRLERKLDYAGIGAVEVIGQAVFVGLAVFLAVRGAGVWAPTVGWLAQQLALLIGYWVRDDYRPRLIWESGLVRDALGFGAIATLSTMAYSLRNLVGPIVVAGQLGAAAMGNYALATRLLEQAGLARQVVTRMSYAVLARVADDKHRLRRALTEGSELQLLAVAAPISVLACVSPWLLPVLFGEDFADSALMVCLLAPAYFATSVFNIHNAAISLRQRPWGLALCHGVNTSLLWVGAVALVGSFGLSAIAYAEWIALASYLVTDRVLATHFPRPIYRRIVVWFIAFTLMCLAPVASWWLLIAASVLLLNPFSIRGVVRLHRRVVARRLVK
jgi:PST family polysaccharide transporter